MERPQWIQVQICLLRMIHLRWRNKFRFINSSAPFWGRRASFLCFSWFLVCLSLVIFFPKLSYAEISWVKYYRTKGAEFCNPASIKKRPDRKEVNVFVLSNYVFQTNSGEKSVLVRQRLDCNRGRYKILLSNRFQKQMPKET